MSQDKETFITEQGLEKLKEELILLKNTKRKEVAERISSAKELGDLSENAEYSEAKDEQLFIENRITELENIVRNVKIIKKNKRSTSVQVGSNIEVSGNGKQMKFLIVGSNEADPKNGKISNESPLGKAFLNHKVNDEIEVIIPAGKTKFKILKIS